MFGIGIGTILAAAAPKILDVVLGAGERYKRGEITREQFAAELNTAIATSLADVEKAWAASFASTYESLMQAATKTPAIARMVAIVCYSQLAVLIWVQAGIPLFELATGTPVPSAGTTADWAYALVGACIGAGYLQSGGAKAALLKLAGKSR